MMERNLTTIVATTLISIGCATAVPVPQTTTSNVASYGFVEMDDPLVETMKKLYNCIGVAEDLTLQMIPMDLVELAKQAYIENCPPTNLDYQYIPVKLITGKRNLAIAYDPADLREQPF